MIFPGTTPVALPSGRSAPCVQVNRCEMDQNSYRAHSPKVCSFQLPKVSNFQLPLTSVWLGAAYELDGDKESAYRAYGIAARRLSNSITLPRPKRRKADQTNRHELSAFGKSLNDLLSYPQGAKFEGVFGQLVDTLAQIDTGTPNQAEAGLRQLGELLGFTATRPDNDEGTGPDVLWLDEEQQRMIGFELKTDKGSPAKYFKKDINQGHGHLEWMKHNYGEYSCLGLLFVGADGTVDDQASPSETMGLCLPQGVVNLRQRVLALIEDFRKMVPIERLAHISKESEETKWDITELVQALWVKDMSALT